MIYDTIIMLRYFRYDTGRFAAEEMMAGALDGMRLALLASDERLRRAVMLAQHGLYMLYFVMAYAILGMAMARR